MSTTEAVQGADTKTVQVYQVYIKATPQKIWDAITQPEWNRRFGYGAPTEYELRAGGAFRSTPSDAMRKASAEMGWPMPDVIIDGKIIESDPPNRLVQSWRMLMDPATAAEDVTTLTYEISAIDNGVSKLTLIHDLTGAPATATMVAGAREAEGGGGGWNWVLDDLKSLLETGVAFAE